MRIITILLTAFGLSQGLASASAPPLLLTASTLDETTRPLPEVRAELRRVVDSYQQGRIELGLDPEPPPVAEGRSDASGELRLEVAEPGLYELTLSSPGRVAITFDLNPLTAATDLGLVMLPKAEELTVRVLGPGGKPVAGARVALSSTARTPRQDRLDLAPAPRRARTDARGQATLVRMPGEEVTVVVVGPDGAWVRRPALDANPVVLQLPGGSRWSTVLKDHEGKPAAGVIARRQGTALAISDAAGVVALALPSPKQSEALLFEASGGRRIEPTAEGRFPRSVLLRSEPGIPPAPHTLPPALRLGGRVTTADGKALPRALVWDLYDPGHATLTGADGRFELVAQRGFSGGFAVAAGAPGWATGEVRTESEHGAFDLSLAPPAALAGRVVDRTGAPVANAEVVFEPTAAVVTVVPARYARSGVDGSFHLEGLSPTLPGTLAGRLPQKASVRTEITPLATGTTRRGLELVLELQRTATGRVVDRAGAAVAGARVSLRSSAESDLRLISLDLGLEALARQADSDRAGRFTLAGIEAGSYDLTVRAPGKIEAAVRGLEIPQGVGDVDLGTVRLDDTVVLTGRVENAAGEPVAGAEVQTRRQRGGRMVLDRARADAEPLISGADGRFLVPDLNPADTYALQVTAPGYAAETVNGLSVPRAEPVVVTLRLGARVRGHVRDGEGKPIAEAEVMVESGDRGILSRLMGGSEPPGTRTDSEGAFELADLQAGSLAVKARARGYVESEPKGVELAPGQVVEDLVIVLPAGATLVGRVLGPEGEPRPDAEVKVRSPGSILGAGSGPRARTDREGRFELQGVPLGDQTFLAEATGFPPKTRSLAVEPGRNSLDFELEPGFEISGRVVGPQGEPIGIGELEVSRRQPGVFGGDFLPLETDGTFRARGLVAGEYQVRASTEIGITTATVTVGPASVVGLVLQITRGAVVSGTITGLDFDTLAKVQVLAFIDPGNFLPGRVDFKGNYRIESLTPGTWNLVVSAGGRRQTKVVEIAPEQTEAVVDVAFEDGLTLAIHVLRGGRPVPGLTLFVGSRLAGGSQVQTDAEGWARAAGLVAGQVRIHILDPQHGFTHNEEVELEASREIEIELGSRSVEGRVVTTDGDPLAAAEVSLEEIGDGLDGGLSSGLRPFTTHSTDSGSFRFSEVPARQLRVVATKAGFAQGEVPCDVTDASAEGLEVRLAPSRGLTLMLRFGAGPVPPDWPVSVHAVGATGETIFRVTSQPDERGRLRLEALPKGSWTLVVFHPSTLVSRIPVVAPGPAVTVRLEPGAVLEVQVPSRQEERGVKVVLIDANGQPVEGLDAVWSGGLSKEWPLQLGRTVIHGLAGGRYTVRVENADGEVLSGSAEVAPGGRATVVIQ